MDTSKPAGLWVDARCTTLQVRHAGGFWSRAAGLWAWPSKSVPYALELRPCAAVHTFAMRVPIDLAFVAADGEVMRTVDRLAPWRIAGFRGATATWELPAGSCAKLGIRVGVRLRSTAAARSTS